MKTPLLAATLARADHVRSFHVRLAFPAGWEASESEDQRIVQQQRYTNWHRVELTLSRYARKIAELRQQGWRET
jgi:hypothetical protein